MGIGHTRWATHGRPTEANAHPHRSADGKVVVVHNGIFENFLELRQELTAAGFTFVTETDTECFPVMVVAPHEGRPSFPEAFRQAVGRMRGIYAIACMHADDPDRILVARSGPPAGDRPRRTRAVPGLGRGPPAPPHPAGDLPGGRRPGGADPRRGPPLPAGRQPRGAAPSRPCPFDPVAAEKGRFKHFMQKEIFEQPLALSNTLLDRLPLDGRADPPGSALQRRGAARLRPDPDPGLRHQPGTRVSSASSIIENLARIGVDVDYGSEYRYRNPVVGPNTLAIGITQSGETADTLAAVKEAASRGARTLAICNVQGSTATRQTEATILTHAGPEIGVASTKAFTTQLVGPAAAGPAAGRGPRAPWTRTCAGSSSRACANCPPSWSAPRRLERQILKWAQQLERSLRLPLPGPRPALSHRPGRRPQAEGDLLHPRRRLPRRRDEARPHRPHRPAPAHRGPHAQGRPPREDPVATSRKPPPATAASWPW